MNNSVKLTGANSLGFSCYAGCTPAYFMLYNNVLDVAGRIGYLEGSMAGGNNVYWRGSMGGLQLMNGDRYVDPRFKGSRLIPTANSPLVDAGRPAPMKKDLNGVRVGVDGNGDGRRGADIGAYEAKAKGHRGGKGHHQLASTAARAAPPGCPPRRQAPPPSGGRPATSTAGTTTTSTTKARRRAPANARLTETWPGGPQGVGVPRARMGARLPAPRGSLALPHRTQIPTTSPGAAGTESTERPGPGGPGRPAVSRTTPDHETRAAIARPSPAGPEGPQGWRCGAPGPSAAGR